jgi:plasmid stabilization system protein ParE
MTYRVVILRAAELDVRQIVDWWGEHSSREQAERFYRSIFPAMAGLAHQPDRCPISPETDLFRTGLRELHFGLVAVPPIAFSSRLSAMRFESCGFVMLHNKT